MSYFNEFLTNEKPKQIENGVFIERRGFLKISAFGLCSLLLNTHAKLQSQELKPDTVNQYDLNKLIQELTPKANNLIKDNQADEEVYLKDLVDMVNKLKGVTHAAITDKRINFTPMHNDVPIKIYQIRMLPGAILPCHDHRDYNGVIQVLDGSANIRNFDFADDKETVQKADTFKVKETQNFIAQKGDVTSLSRTRDNIHEIIAGENGILFLDIFTFYNQKGFSKYLQLDKKSIDEKNKIFQASWK